MIRRRLHHLQSGHDGSCAGQWTALQSSDEVNIRRGSVSIYTHSNFIPSSPLTHPWIPSHSPSIQSATTSKLSLFRSIPLVFVFKKQLNGIPALSFIAVCWSHHVGMKPAPTHFRSVLCLCALYMRQDSMQSDCVATLEAVSSFPCQPWPQMVV